MPPPPPIHAVFLPALTNVIGFGVRAIIIEATKPEDMETPGTRKYPRKNFGRLPIPKSWKNYEFDNSGPPPEEAQKGKIRKSWGRSPVQGDIRKTLGNLLASTEKFGDEVTDPSFMNSVNHQRMNISSS